MTMHNMNSFSGYDVAKVDTYYMDLPVATAREYVKQATRAQYDAATGMFRITASLQALWTLQDACGDNTGYSFSIFHS